jgi:hypothetical protein
MTKQELELRIGYELTQIGWEHLEKMYMGCDLDKDTFAKIVKGGAKIFKVEEKKNVTYKGVLIEWVDYMGCYVIKDTYITNRRGTYFEHLDDAKRAIKDIRG